MARAVRRACSVLTAAAGSCCGPTSSNMHPGSLQQSVTRFMPREQSLRQAQDVLAQDGLLLGRSAEAPKVEQRRGHQLRAAYALSRWTASSAMVHPGSLRQSAIQFYALIPTYWASRRMSWRRVGSCWGAALRRRNMTSAEGTSCAARMLCADGASGFRSGPTSSYVHPGSLRQSVSHSNISDTGSPAAHCIIYVAHSSTCCVCTYKEQSSCASMPLRKCQRINDVRQLEVLLVMLQKGHRNAQDERY